jgi:glycosyltransferase involved in cell wall biosynthesis
VGKYSAAKGVPWLLDAVERIVSTRPSVRLHIAGSGAGDEAESLRARMDRMAPVVIQHGQLSQPELGDLARRCHVCVLPSFYEGLPLVLAEALACGCRLVATNLPGIQKELAPRFGEALDVIDLPRLEAVDRPMAEDLPAFVDHLERALVEALGREPLGDPGITMPESLRHFTWNAVYDRVEKVWFSLT